MFDHINEHQEESLDPVVARLQRELYHVNEQLKVEHGMTLSWKARALAAEKKLPKPKKKAGAEEPALSMHTSGSDELDGLIDPCVTEGEMV
jgi:hypothetical protein